MQRILPFALVIGSTLPALARADDKTAADLAQQLRQVEANVFSADAAKAKQLDQMVARDIRARIHTAHQREAEAFNKLQNRAEWERFRDVRRKALQDSLGDWPTAGKKLNLQVTRTYEGQGYRRDDVVFESLPGLIVTANLYRPAMPPAKGGMPGLIIIHGFHQPKHQGELQDMGVNWARQGCVVLVPDVLGHGERRQHPFSDAGKFAGKFNVARQDYYGRANTGLQLALAGESLMGCMVNDVARCVDLLTSRPDVDKERIIVLGAVAAGGDVAAVAAALDKGIAAAVPYNFGGPEPETDYPLPAEPEKAFPYGSGGHWDNTRRLRNSAHAGFLPWIVLGTLAPRPLVYAHEFAWDKEHDPVWPRLQKIYGWYDAKDKVAFAHGSGTLFGKPEGTGCANIGAVHRLGIYPHFQRWFQMQPPDKETQDRKPPSDLLCLTPEIEKKLKPRTLQELAAEAAGQRMTAARQRLAALPLAQRRRKLQADWAMLLGDVAPQEPKATSTAKQRLGNITLERLVFEVEPGVVVPALLLLPTAKPNARMSVVVGVAQHGKQAFLRERSADLAQLLAAGVAVCLPDVRGTGETRPEGDLRGPPAGSYKGVRAGSNGTLLANEDLMLGRTLLGDRLRDLRSVLRHLRGRPEFDPKRIALWGDSFAPVNAGDAEVKVPWDAEKLPAQAEPLGGLLALFCALFEEDIRAVSIHGSLASYASLLQGPFAHVAHDVIVPGAVPAGDLPEVAAVLAPRPLRLAGLVDGVNRSMTAVAVEHVMVAALEVYRAEKASAALTTDGRERTPEWLLKSLK